MLPPLDAYQRRPCCHRPLKTWWLPWEHGLSPQGLVLCGSHGWWPYLGLWGQGKFSACHLPSLGMSGCWPMVWAQSVWWWFSARPSLLTPSWSPPCTRWAPSVCRAGLLGLWGRSWCCTCPACLRCSQSCWGTELGGPWYCRWSLILAPHRWGRCDFLCLLHWLGVWNDSSHLIGRHHVSRVKVINPVYNGLERSVFSRSILTLFMSRFETLWP